VKHAVTAGQEQGANEMPRLRRRGKRQRQIEYTEAHRDVLRRGRTPVPQSAVGFYAGGDLDTDAVAEGWGELRDELLPAYIAERPGQRPAAWWWFDAPEPARRVLRGHDVLADPDTPAWARQKVSFGACKCYNKPAWENPPVIESQAAYLDRHGLLTDDERKQLGEDFDREEQLFSL